MKKEVYEHTDRLGQPIRPGDYVAFTWSGGRGVRVGNIASLTRLRVRITFTYSYERNGERVTYPCRHITRPEDCVILGEQLQQHLTLATLQKKI